MEKGIIRIPATTANLGPGFDVLGLSLDLWNEISFEFKDTPSRIKVSGEGSEILPTTEYNLIMRSIKKVYDHFDQPWPTKLFLQSKNKIPIFSGLGSSAAAVLAGVLIGNQILENPLREDEILDFCTRIEGHPDNIVPAFLGGLVLSTYENNKLLTFKYSIPDWKTIIILPDVRLSTIESRKALPTQIPYASTIFNLGRIPLVIDALRNNDLEKLRIGMKDRIHENFRLALIPGAKEALSKARKMGAAAALSGAGPSIIAFAKDNFEDIQKVMQEEFSSKGLSSRSFLLSTINSGAEII